MAEQTTSRRGRVSYSQQIAILTPEQIKKFESLTAKDLANLSKEELKLYRAWLNSTISQQTKTTYQPRVKQPVQYGLMLDASGNWVDNPNVLNINLLEIQSRAKRKPQIAIRKNENGILQVRTDGFNYLPLKSISIDRDGNLQLTISHQIAKEDRKTLEEFLKSKYVPPPKPEPTKITTETKSEQPERPEETEEPKQTEQSEDMKLALELLKTGEFKSIKEALEFIKQNT
jgi:hypothetical protein